MSTSIIDALVRSVCAECGVKPSLLWSSHKEVYVDARCVVCTFLSELGMTDMEISMVGNITRQGVNKLRNSFYYKHKLRWSVRAAYKRGREIIKHI